MNFAPIRKACAMPSGFACSAYSMRMPRCAVAQIIAKHRQIFRRRNDQDFAQAAEHERGERIADHRLVVNGEKLFADDLGERKKTRAGAACEKNGFLVHELVFGFLSALLRLHRASNSDHSCQKLACLVKLIPIFSSSRRIIFFGKEKRDALSKRNELPRRGINLRSLSRPPSHRRNALFDPTLRQFRIAAQSWR